MKTLNKQLQALVVVLFGFIAIPVQASLSYTARFDINQLDTTIQVVDDVSYLHLKYSDLYTAGEIGAPELPVHYLRFSVPYNATNFTVSATPTTTITHTYAHLIYPIQPPIPTNANLDELEFVMPDSTIYNSNQFYPATPVKVVEKGFLGGDNHIVTIALYPIAYAPLTGEAKFYSSISVTLNYTIGSNSSDMLPIFPRKSVSVRQSDITHVEQIVVNPTQVENSTPTLSVLNQTSTPSTELPAYQYCVVTSRELAPAFDRLIAWKRQKGYTAGVVCIEDILVHPNYQEGDVVSNINDDAGKLRAYLRETYQRGINQYTLLAGNYTVLPIRYGHGANYSETMTVLNTTKIPTDLYFSDFNGNWNVDNDAHYGEPYADKIDFYPEIYVGRLLCTNRQEITNYTDKLFKYERNPGNGDFSYLKKAFYFQSDHLQMEHEADSVVKEFNSIFTTQTIFNELPSYNHSSPTFPTGGDVINEMNNRYGFFSWHGHGSPVGITVKSNGANSWNNYAIIPFDGALNNHPEHYWMIVENGHGLDNLTNQDYPAIAYSTSCDVTPFDIYGEYNEAYNIGSSFTTRGLYGGPAFLGNTRSGYWGDRTSGILEEGFAQEIKNGYCNIGVAEARSKCNKILPPLYQYKVRLTHSLIGCPEFAMWTDIPVLYNDISIQRTDNGITISSNEINE